MAEISKTVANALQLLSCFSRIEPMLTVAELTRRLGLPRTNVLRVLATLEQFGFVQRHPDGTGYQVGVRAFELGTLFLTANPLSSLLIRSLDWLVEQTGCTAYLGTLDRDDVVILTYREGTLPVRFIWQVGARLPCTTAALGKAMLMHMSKEEVDRHLGRNQPLRGLTEHSIRTRKELDSQLSVFRKRGWALAREESHPGLTAVGAAVLNGSHRPVAAISVSFLDHPHDPRRLERLATVVCEAARDISRKVGDHGLYGDRLGADPPRTHFVQARGAAE